MAFVQWDGDDLAHIRGAVTIVADLVRDSAAFEAEFRDKLILIRGVDPLDSAPMLLFSDALLQLQAAEFAMNAEADTAPGPIDPPAFTRAALQNMGPEAVDTALQIIGEIPRGERRGQLSAVVAETLKSAIVELSAGANRLAIELAALRTRVEPEPAEVIDGVLAQWREKLPAPLLTGQELFDRVKARKVQLSAPVGLRLLFTRKFPEGELQLAANSAEKFANEEKLTAGVAPSLFAEEAATSAGNITTALATVVPGEAAGEAPAGQSPRDALLGSLVRLARASDGTTNRKHHSAVMESAFHLGSALKKILGAHKGQGALGEVAHNPRDVGQVVANQVYNQLRAQSLRR